MLVKVLSVYMYQQKKTKFAKQIIFISLSNHDHARESNPFNFTAGNFIRLWHNEALKMNISNYINTSFYILMNKKKYVEDEGWAIIH